MTTPLTIALALTAVNIAIMCWSTITSRRTRRARQQFEEEQRARATMLTAMLRAMGAQLMESVEPEEIQAGDAITFKRTHEDGCLDDSAPPVEYKAGFNGDTGNLTGGVFLRPSH